MTLTLEQKCALLDAADIMTTGTYIRGVGGIYLHNIHEDNGACTFYYGDGSPRPCYLIDAVRWYTRNAQDRIVEISELRDTATYYTSASEYGGDC